MTFAHDYAVGLLAGRINRDVQKLTPACLGNLCAFASNYRTVLRHVIGRAEKHPATAEILRSIDDGTATTGGGFWHGFYQATKPEKVVVSL